MKKPTRSYMDLYEGYRQKMEMLTAKQIQEEVELMTTLKAINDSKQRAHRKTHRRAASTLPPLSHPVGHPSISRAHSSAANILPPVVPEIGGMPHLDGEDLIPRSSHRQSSGRHQAPSPNYIPMSQRKTMGKAIRPPTVKYIPGAQLPGVQRGAGEAGVLCVRDTTTINFCPIPTLPDHRVSMERKAYTARNSMYTVKVPTYCPTWIPNGPYAETPKPIQPCHVV